MKRFKKILYLNEPGLALKSIPKRVLKLARNNGARLTLCDVVEEMPRSLVNLEKTFKDLRRKQLMSLLEGADVDDLDIKTKVLSGTTFIEVIKEVARGKHDLLIKSTEGSMLGRLFGSTDMHLMRKCPCPVWIIKSAKKKKYTRILAAVDPSPEVPANAELNKMILELSSSLAEQEGSELHVVHSWFVQNENLLRSTRAMKKSEINKIVRDSKNAHEAWLEELLEAHQLEDKAQIHLLKGEPGLVIPELADEKKVELIVMGTVARTGIPGFFIGNTAEKILGAVDCSVLTIKPKEFSTPVKT